MDGLDFSLTVCDTFSGHRDRPAECPLSGEADMAPTAIDPRSAFACPNADQLPAGSRPAGRFHF